MLPHVARPFYGLMLLAIVTQTGSSQVRLTRDTARLDLIGSGAEDRRRLEQLGGNAAPTGWMFRTASSTADTSAVQKGEIRWGLLPGYAELTWNSLLPFSLNDGALWAGRGLSFAAVGGVSARVGRFSLRLAPMLWHSQNQQTSVLPGGDPGRRAFSNPWHVGAISADIPLRFGHRPTTAIDLGESALWITARGLSGGFSTESQWWGPGIRNALLMSNNAGGFPHAFVTTARPVRTRAGEIEARWVAGGLMESRFFDHHTFNDSRSLSAAAVALTPSIEPHLTFGLARAVYASVSSAGGIPAHAVDALFRWRPGGNPRADTTGRAAEQLTSVFGRWVFPNDDGEVYGEWGRMIMPISIRSFLVAPQFTQGFTVGAQWVMRSSARSRYRLQVEFTNLEQSPKSRQADTLSFYTSRAVPQGYTHRGQVIGAAIGPGSSSQWFALDRLARHLDVGVFVGRIRWDTDAYYTQTTSIYYNSYDASVYSGVRAAGRHFGREMSAEFLVQRRYNYLFQNALEGWSPDAVFDRSNTTVRVRVF